ncbi:fibrillin-1-like [Liolophura sinensis]|uniref:fibrillin-1-like n=1 Tax=Liolophura sinensis TaxID=3198878 RepID=UPI00315819BE
MVVCVADIDECAVDSGDIDECAVDGGGVCCGYLRVCCRQWWIVLQILISVLLTVVVCVADIDECAILMNVLYTVVDCVADIDECAVDGGDIDECAVDNGGCGDQTCYNELGSYHCDCQPGHRWHADDKECKPLCFGLPPGQCHNGGKCTSPNVCSCQQGYATPECTGECVMCDVIMEGSVPQLMCAPVSKVTPHLSVQQGYATPECTGECVMCDVIMEGSVPQLMCAPVSRVTPHLSVQGYATPECTGECVMCDVIMEGSVPQLMCAPVSKVTLHLSIQGYATPECTGECVMCDVIMEGNVPQLMYAPVITVTPHLRVQQGYATPECTDIDECEVDNGNCKVECVNIAGAYYCKTASGHGTLPGKDDELPLCFMLPPGNCPNDGTCISPESCQCKHGYVPPICDDYNECTKPDICELGCHNTDGSYFCDCRQGYMWDAMDFQCKPSCFDLPHGQCPNGGSCLRPGVCQCSAGFKIPDCSDIDECSADSSACELECHNIEGSYSCDCHEGFSWDAETMACLPVCYGEVAGVCPNGGTCKSPNRCSCAPGYQEPQCTDIDECSADESVCLEGVCSNLMGSYMCGCEQGYAWSDNTESCQPVCQYHAPGVCPNGGSCVSPGVCLCMEGYDSADDCKDIDECGTDNGGCNLECVNLPGSYYCMCEKDGFGKSLTDTECKPLCFGERPGTCPNQGDCTAPGACSCLDGYSSPGCEDVTECAVDIGDIDECAVDSGGVCVSDIDECAVDNGGCAGDCQNINGSHYCACEHDHGWNVDLHSCQPMCFGMKAGRCLNGGKCTQPNTCSCLRGYELPKCSGESYLHGYELTKCSGVSYLHGYELPKCSGESCLHGYELA